MALASPAVRATKRVAAQKRERDRRGDPAWHAYKVAAGKRLRRDYDADDVAQARNAATRADVGRQIAAQRNAWMPAQHHARWLPRYQQLRKRNPAPVAQHLVLEEIARAELRVLDVEAAAHFLGRLAPTYQCDGGGRPKRWGGFWRVGNAVLDRDALILRAARKGWPAAAHLQIGEQA